MNKLNRQTDHKEQHNLYCCTCSSSLYVGDPATFLASNSILGPYFPLRTACLFTDILLPHHNIANIQIVLSLYFFSKATRCPSSVPDNFCGLI